jgi:hypothetical protein
LLLSLISFTTSLETGSVSHEPGGNGRKSTVGRQRELIAAERWSGGTATFVYAEPGIVVDESAEASGVETSTMNCSGTRRLTVSTTPGGLALSSAISTKRFQEESWTAPGAAGSVNPWDDRGGLGSERRFQHPPAEPKSEMATNKPSGLSDRKERRSTRQNAGSLRDRVLRPR